jgi:hypothetical protein
MLEPYSRTYPSRQSLSREARKQQILRRYDSASIEQQREAQLVIMRLIADAVATIRRQDDAVGTQHRL